MMWRGEIRTKISPLGPEDTEDALIAVRLDYRGSPGRDRGLEVGSRVIIHARDEDPVLDYRERYLSEQTERDRREREELEETTRRIGRELGNRLAQITREVFGERVPDPGPTELLHRAHRDLAAASRHLRSPQQQEVGTLLDRLWDLLEDVEG